jgi:hypothetical protein
MGGGRETQKTELHFLKGLLTLENDVESSILRYKTIIVDVIDEIYIEIFLLHVPGRSRYIDNLFLRHQIHCF